MINQRTLINSFHPTIWQFATVLIAATLLLSGCGGMSFSPTDAAVRSVMQNNMPEFVVDPNSVEVLQQVNLDNASLVMIRFSGLRGNSGKENCLFLQRVEKTRLGTWLSLSGGGGCTNAEPNPAQEPISVGGSITSGSEPADPGYSAISGQVYRDDVDSVRVTWSDGQVQEVDVVNGSYIAAREGMIEMSKVEALDDQNKVIYSNEPRVAPGKE